MTDQTDTELRTRLLALAAAVPLGPSASPTAETSAVRRGPLQLNRPMGRAGGVLSLVTAATILALLAIYLVAGSPGPSPSPAADCGPDPDGRPGPGRRRAEDRHRRAASRWRRGPGCGRQRGHRPARQTPPLTRECVPVGTCQVIGTLDGFDDPDGTVTIRQAEFIVPPPTTAAALHGPVALRLAGTAPIEYLGPVSLGAGARPASVAETLAATATAPAGEVIGVAGWLEDAGVPSCGPAPQPGPTVPEPFRCQTGPNLMADPVKPVTRNGNESSVSYPAGSVPVQEGAYAEFAPNPAFDGTNYEPRLAIYLIRMVVDDAVNCTGCRGWLVVGRLDASPTPTPSASPAVAVTVRSAAELAALLGADRASWVGRVVFVDGQVLTGPAPSCAPGSTCPIGLLGGTNERVLATTYTASQLLPDTDYPTNGVMALIVRDQGLEYLGYMGYNDDNTFVFRVDQLLDPQSGPRGPEMVIVTGWLVDSALPFPCPTVDGPPDTPFETCGAAWVTTKETQPVIVSPGGTASVVPPRSAVRVQSEAYTEFAADPAFEANGVAHIPRLGTYLLRLVSNPSSASKPSRGWQVVARLDPSPVSVGPSPSVASGDAAPVAATALAYETARASGDWQQAWSLLSDYSRSQAGSLATYEPGQAAYNAAGGVSFTMMPPTKDPDLLGPAYLGEVYADVVAHADVTRGWLVSVLHPKVNGASAGSEVLLVAPVGDRWVVWIAH